MDWDTILNASTLIATAIVFPGQNFAIVARQAACHSRYAGLATALGIAITSLLWAALSVTGISALLKVYPQLGRLLWALGTAYLLMLGAYQFCHSYVKARPKRVMLSRTAATHTAFLLGLVTGFSNIKAALFYTSAFAISIPPGSTAITVGTVLVAAFWISLTWYSAVAWVVGLYERKTTISKSKLERGSACMLILAALYMLLARPL